MANNAFSRVTISLALVLASPAGAQLYTPPSAQDIENERQRQQMEDNFTQMRSMHQQQQELDALRLQSWRMQDDLNRMRVEQMGRHSDDE